MRYLHVLRGIIVCGSCCLSVTASVFIAGCTASGYAEFVKFSPDGRHLVYEDARYPRVYVYDLESHQKRVLIGSVAWMDAGVEHLLLTGQQCRRGYYREDAITCSFVDISGPVALEQKLPPITIPSGGTLLMDLKPPDTVIATVLQCRHPPYRGECYALQLGEAEWRPVAPCALPEPAEIEMRSCAPAGVYQGRHYYAPNWWPDVDLGREAFGEDVSVEVRPFERVLHGPGDHYHVEIGDAHDVWKRMTLIDTRTGRKEVILDKNDAAADVLHFLQMLPMLPIAPFIRI